MNYIKEALNDVLNERINEISLSVMNSPEVSPTYSEVCKATDDFRKMLADNENLLEAYDEVLSLMRSYYAEETEACYVQGFRDFRNLLLGKTDTLLEKE